jgi:DNA-directed RNA polymerase subunit RPC12/RpoP
MAAKCFRCSVILQVDTELDRKYGGARSFRGFDAGGQAMSHQAQKQKDLDAAGVSCAECGKSFCSKCMLTHGRRHPVSGGLACLSCGGRMTQYCG